MTRERKLLLTVALFVVALVILFVTGTTHSVVPLFFIWIPLLTVPYVLTRPEPGFPVLPPAEPNAPEQTSPEAAATDPA